MSLTASVTERMGMGDAWTTASGIPFPWKSGVGPRVAFFSSSVFSASLLTGAVTTDAVPSDILSPIPIWQQDAVERSITTAQSPSWPDAARELPASKRLEAAVPTRSVGEGWERTEPGVQLRASGSVDKLTRLRRLSGLTWDQLASLFQVDRRSVHYWASGRVMGARHEEQLGKLLAVLSWADRGTAQQNRSALLSPAGEHGLVLALLQASRYEEACAALGKGEGRREVPLPNLTSEEEQWRLPPKPEALVDAIQESIPTGTSRPRAVRVRRGPGLASVVQTAAPGASETRSGAGSGASPETVFESKTEADT